MTTAISAQSSGLRRLRVSHFCPMLADVGNYDTAYRISTGFSPCALYQGTT